MGLHKAYKVIKILHFKLMYIFVFFGLSTILPLAIYLNCNILKFCCKQQNFCCLLFLNQSITTCVHLPKNTATSVQVILLCHVKGNKIWGSMTCRKFLDNLSIKQLLVIPDPLIHLWEPWTLIEHTNLNHFYWPTNALNCIKLKG